MKINYGMIVWALVLTSALFTACKDDEGGGAEEDSNVNRWIEKTLREDYLWNAEIPVAGKLNYSADPKVFYYSLLSQKDGKTRNGSHYYYSYIEENKDYTGTRTSIDRDDTYGMEFVVFAVTDSNRKPTGYYWARILYVLPNGPAQEAGLKRGDWLVGFDGRNDNIKGSEYNRLIKGGALQLTVSPNPNDTKKYRTVPLEPSRGVIDHPLFASTTVEAGGRKIGYLIYNHFTTGPGDHTDRTYDREMEEMFRNFANQGVNEFVLDLRYNGGGYLSSANVLAALLVSEQHKDAIFCINTDNKGQQSKRYFSSEKTTPHLRLNRLFVLTGSSTASASEAVINGLSPFLDITLVGEQTEGKNVASVHYAKDEYKWALQPIIGRITSSDTTFDYSAGFRPDVPCDELGKENTTGELLPLGDKNEFMFKKAIELITGNRSVGVRSSTPSVQSQYDVVYKSVDRHQTNGVLLAPDYTRDAFWRP